MIWYVIWWDIYDMWSVIYMIWYASKVTHKFKKTPQHSYWQHHSAAWQCLPQRGPYSWEPIECQVMGDALTSCIEPRLITMRFPHHWTFEESPSNAAWFMSGVDVLKVWHSSPENSFSDGTCQLWYQWDRHLSECLCTSSNGFQLYMPLYIPRSCEYNTLYLHWNKCICPVPGRWLMRQKLHFIFLSF